MSSLSPTALLWRHQLKREHSLLLTRIQKLEDIQTLYATTRQSLDALQNSVNDITTESKREIQLQQDAFEQFRTTCDQAVGSLRTELSSVCEEVGKLKGEIFKLQATVDEEQRLQSMRRTKIEEAERTSGIERPLQSQIITAPLLVEVPLHASTSASLLTIDAAPIITPQLFENSNERNKSNPSDSLEKARNELRDEAEISTRPDRNIVAADVDTETESESSDTVSERDQINSPEVSPTTLALQMKRKRKSLEHLRKTKVTRAATPTPKDTRTRTKLGKAIGKRKGNKAVGGSGNSRYDQDGGKKRKGAARQKTNIERRSSGYMMNAMPSGSTGEQAPSYDGTKTVSNGNRTSHGKRKAGKNVSGKRAQKKESTSEITATSSTLRIKSDTAKDYFTPIILERRTRSGHSRTTFDISDAGRLENTGHS